ncbi:TLC domain-containing protein 2-like [Oppia nitens]|uniref:TLC domain-containing protein 2-like n=1 Tax=Oppia nitens TaxID=1686743 RepID=UPI0023DAF847|nr:TLC domain-containing protein 2-like [Oppia nitens]
MSLISSHYGLVVTMMTALALSAFNKYLKRYPYRLTDQSANKSVDQLAKKLADNEYKSWKWRNITIAFMHSIISSFWGLFALIIDPEVALDMIDRTSVNSYLVLCFSNGYFIYDLHLSLTNLSYKGRSEIILHHLLTISCLTVSTVTKRFSGYCLTALTVEVSNIFLHWRQLLYLSDVPNDSKTYRLNSIILIISMIIMRLFPLSWIMFCLYMEKESINCLNSNVGQSGLQ